MEEILTRSVTFVDIRFIIPIVKVTTQTQLTNQILQGLQEEHQNQIIQKNCLALEEHKLIRIMTSGKSKKQCRVCASKKIRGRTCFVCKFCNIPLRKGDRCERYDAPKKNKK